MVESDTEALDSILRALADPTRRAMLRLLANGECSVGELAAPFHMSFAGAAKHVKALESAGLVSRTVAGRTHVCRLEAAPLAAVDEWLRFYEVFWRGRLDELHRVLSEASSRDEGA